MQSVAVN